MKAFEIKKGVYWVGAVDWHPPNFGYGLSKGTSYNSYLILDDKTALIDTVKHGFTHEIISRIEDVIDPLSIDYIIIGNYKMDHSGSLPFIMKRAKNATIVTNESSKKAIEKYHGAKWNFLIVKNGDYLDLGGRKIEFIEYKMENSDILISYSAPDRILFSEELFSQHIASSFRFDFDINGIEEDALSYFVNYVMPLDKIPDFSKKEIETLAPNHGCIWKEKTDKIIEDYRIWIKGISKDKVSVLYSSTWRGTEKMAYAIADGLISTGIEVNVLNSSDQDIGNIAKHIFDSSTVVIGCPSSKSSIQPELSGIFSYLNSIGLKKPVALFTCYEGKKSPVKILLDNLSILNFDLIEKPLEVQYAPDESELKKCFDFGVRISERTKNTKRQ